MSGEYENIMVDLETMGTHPGAPIIAIGSVFFDARGLGPSHYVEVNLESCTRLGMRIDANTVIWWMGQSEEARSAFKNNAQAAHLQDALLMLSDFMGNVCRTNQPKVWGNGASFDNVILGNAYDVCGMARPWAFYNDRCYRTAKNVCEYVPFTPPEVAHNALSDAIAQATHLVEIAKKSGEICLS